jgi:hypothetical protein
MPSADTRNHFPDEVRGDKDIGGLQSTTDGKDKVIQRQEIEASLTPQV